jgi:transposase
LFLDLINYSNYEHDESEIKDWLKVVRSYKISEMNEAANTIENWLPYIVNSFIDKRFSNGFTEGLNNKIKVIKRVGFVYKNFDFFRLKTMYILNVKVRGLIKKDRNEKNEKLRCFSHEKIQKFF